MFDEIPERLYTIECEGYFDKNGNPLDDEESIKHLTSGEPPVDIDAELELCDENGDVIDYVIYDDYRSRDHNKLILNADEQRSEIVNLIDTKRMNYDKVLVKIEDKKECKLLKELMKDRYKIALYTGDIKEIKLNEDGLFDEDVDVIISTSPIQNGQSIYIRPNIYRYYL